MVNRKWQWAGVVMFILGAIAAAGNFALSRGHPDEIADARIAGAVLAAGLAIVGAILAITAYLSSRDEREKKVRLSGRELVALILVVLGVLGITNIIGWWHITGDVSGGLLSIGVDLIVIAVGAILLRKPDEKREGV